MVHRDLKPGDGNPPQFAPRWISYSQPFCRFPRLVARLVLVKLENQNPKTASQLGHR
jgi:hypothetical protein